MSVDEFIEREQSPDWLRSFQAPSRSFLSLSSDSNSSPSNSPSRDEDNREEVPPAQNVEKEVVIYVDSGDDNPTNNPKKPRTIPKKGKQVEDNDLIEEMGDDGEAAEEENSKKPTLPNVSSRLPLLLPEKVQRMKALVECEGDSIDLSGDVGAVGRVIISKTSLGNDEMLLDLKGTIYKTTIVPSTTFCVVSFGQTEAKIESIMTDYIQLRPHSNVFEAETMIEGTLEGFSFDSDDEGDKLPKTHHGDQGNENVDQINVKPNKKEKSKGPMQKKVKITAKPAKRAVRKSLNTKKGKSLKK